MFLLDNSFWQVRQTPHKGLGIFAAKPIKSGTVISDYLGKVVRTAEYDLSQDEQGLYLMYFSDSACIYPDLKIPGPHLVNHSCSPNCWIHIHKGHTLFFAINDIVPGEEITISYLLSPKDDCINCLHDCKCDSKNCTGTMHLSKEAYSHWQKYLQEMPKQIRSRIIYSKNLAPLPQ